MYVALNPVTLDSVFPGGAPLAVIGPASSSSSSSPSSYHVADDVVPVIFSCSSACILCNRMLLPVHPSKLLRRTSKFLPTVSTIGLAQAARLWRPNRNNIQCLPIITMCG